MQSCIVHIYIWNLEDCHGSSNITVGCPELPLFRPTRELQIPGIFGLGRRARTITAGRFWPGLLHYMEILAWTVARTLVRRLEIPLPSGHLPKTFDAILNDSSLPLESAKLPLIVEDYCEMSKAAVGLFKMFYQPSKITRTICPVFASEFQRQSRPKFPGGRSSRFALKLCKQSSCSTPGQNFQARNFPAVASEFQRQSRPKFPGG